MQSQQAVDILVDTRNPADLDRIVQQFGAAVVGAPNYVQHEGHYVVRVFGDPGFVEFMINQQGYGSVIRRLDYLVNLETQT